MNPRRLAALLVSLAVVVYGCSSDDPPDSAGSAAIDRLIAATEATRGAGTARMEQTIVMSFPKGAGAGAPEVAGGSVEVVAEGYLDLRGRRGRLDVSTEGSGIAGADALGGDM